MSEKQEHRRRFEARLRYLARFEAWLAAEPPMWKIFSWVRWKSSRPQLEEESI